MIFVFILSDEFYFKNSRIILKGIPLINSSVKRKYFVKQEKMYHWLENSSDSAKWIFFQTLRFDVLRDIVMRTYIYIRDKNAEKCIPWLKFIVNTALCARPCLILLLLFGLSLDEAVTTRWGHFGESDVDYKYNTNNNT